MSTPRHAGPVHGPGTTGDHARPPAPGKPNGAHGDAHGTAPAGVPVTAPGAAPVTTPEPAEAPGGAHGTHGPRHTDGASAPSAAPGPSDTLLPAAEREEFTRRMHQAVKGFVDSPRHSVEEADALFEDVTRRIGAVLAERHRGLRGSWHGPDGRESTAETEELRNALRHYRDAAERLLRL
ncbi:hypothetical protein [Streptomyces sp. URMC 125]|uniref:hypothetical protein n=1 Tax=Streptomyces sp. URMC 125 TaxID=3423419 RepID=UPI003F1A7479